jgi:hypothetical protein
MFAPRKVRYNIFDARCGAIKYTDEQEIEELPPPPAREPNKPVRLAGVKLLKQIHKDKQKRKELDAEKHASDMKRINKSMSRLLTEFQ